MELIYLYIEDDGKNIRDCEFNFSPEFRISYDRKKKFLNVVNNKNYIDNFWEANNILNITAVIGKNGSGKSNLLEYIFRYHVSSFGVSPSYKKNIILVYRINGVLYINREDIESKHQIRKSSNIQPSLNNIQKHFSTKLLYYSSSYEKHMLFELGGKITSEDLSTGGLLRKYAFDRRVLKRSKEFGDIERLFVEDTFRQLDLILYSNSNFFKDLVLPDRLSFLFKDGATKLKTQDQHYNKLYIETSTNKLNFKEYIVNCFLNSIFDDANGNPKPIKSELGDNVFAFVKSTYAGALFTELDQLFQDGKIEVRKYPHEMGLRKDHPFQFSIHRNDLSFDLIIAIYQFYFKNNDVFADSTTLGNVRGTYNPLEIFWEGISAGELEYLNFLSRIYSSLKNVIIDYGKKAKELRKPDNYNNIILLLDEPEKTYHPEWQRLFIDNLLHFLKNALPYHTFQIIITSHSPILISDFPRENIIFLDRNQEGNCVVVDSISRDNTFGANIHTLYRNSFFIDGLPIGEFAKNKINKLFAELQDSTLHRSSTSILREIQMVGEPILRDELMKMYKQKVGLPDDVNRRIAELEKEINILKGRLND